MLILKIEFMGSQNGKIDFQLFLVKLFLIFFICLNYGYSKQKMTQKSFKYFFSLTKVKLDCLIYDYN